jgi:hypothetical protein
MSRHFIHLLAANEGKSLTAVLPSGFFDGQ